MIINMTQDDQLRVVLEKISKVDTWWRERATDLISDDGFIHRLYKHRLLEHPHLFLPKLFASMVFLSEEWTADYASRIFDQLASIGQEHFQPEIVWPVLRSLVKTVYKDAPRFWLLDKYNRTLYRASYCDESSQQEIPLGDLKFRNFLLYQDRLLVLLGALVTVCKTIPPRDLLLQVSDFLDKRLEDEKQILKLFENPSEVILSQLNDALYMNLGGAVIARRALNACFNKAEAHARADFQAILRTLDEPLRTQLGLIKGLSSEN